MLPIINLTLGRMLPIIDLTPAQGIASSSVASPFSIELFLENLYSPPPVLVLEPQSVGVAWE